MSTPVDYRFPPQEPGESRAVSPQSQSTLAELFALDPLKYSEQDLDRIIAEFRDKRKQFNLGNLQAGSTKPKSAKAEASLELGKRLGLNLGDL